MIAKITKGGAFKGAVNYILDKAKGTELIASDGVRTLDNNSIIQSFVMQTQLNPNISKAVGHISLDFSAQDKASLTNDFMLKVAQEYMQKMGIVNTQYIIGRHFDKDHPHIHICYNRIDNVGKVISDKNDRYRSGKICKELTLKHGLYFATGKERVKMHRLKEPIKTKYEIYRALNDAIPMSSNWNELIEYLKCDNIDVQFKTKGNSSEIQGVLFSKNGFSFSGSRVDKKFSYSKINSLLSENNHSKNKSQNLSPNSLSKESSKAQGTQLFDMIPSDLYSSIDEEPSNRKRRNIKR